MPFSYKKYIKSADKIRVVPVVTSTDQSQSKSKGPASPKSQTNKLCELVTVSHDGGWRDEIEIEMRNEDGESYTGSVTMTEAKHGIYRDGIGFKDFKNFDGVRFSYRGIRIVTYKLLFMPM